MPHGHSTSDPVELRSVLRWVTEQQGSKWAPRLELVCAEHPDPQRGVSQVEVIGLAGCAAQVAPHELLELLVAGAHSVTIRLDQCARSARVQDNLSHLTELFAATGMTSLRLSITPPKAKRRRTVLDSARMPVSRRRLLTLGLSGNGDSSFAPPTPDLSHSDPQRETVALRYLLSQHLKNNSERKDHVLAALKALDSPAVKLAAPGCVACNVCVRTCPSDALRLNHSGPPGTLTVSTLSQQPALCDGCNFCVSACPKDVLSIAGTWDWATTLFPPNSPLGQEHVQHQEVSAPVVSLTTATCERCNARFPSTEATSLCQVCTYRRKNPFASSMPPGFRPPPSAAG